MGTRSENGAMKPAEFKTWVVLFFAGLVTGCGLLGLPGDVCAQEPKKILSIEAYDMLNTLPDTYLIDVRTRAEYQFVGHPVNAYLFPYRFLTNEFVKENEQHQYRLTAKNDAFVAEIGKAFKKEDNLLIMGRGDGTRSIPAAKDLVGAGFQKVFILEDGFEGPEFPFFEDSNRHKFYRQLAKRNKIPGYKHRRYYGWQWWGLPWTYEIDPKFIYPPDREPAE
ncbi:MAG: rhodanese-like domain-containing protein, partial [Thermodesulfobacteriota bacterium]